jgi:hypothetical protein
MVSMMLQCTGGGILVPIFLNAVPVLLAQDAYPIAIAVSFALHTFFPIMRDVMSESLLLHSFVIVLYETLRASVVVNWTRIAAQTIPPSDFGAMPVLGPIFCGGLVGCGGAFLPLNKGLDPILRDGLAQPMRTSLIGAAFYHLLVNTSLSDGMANPGKKAQVVIALFFIGHHWYTHLVEHHAQGAGKPKKVSDEKLSKDEPIKIKSEADAKKSD